MSNVHNLEMKKIILPIDPLSGEKSQTEQKTQIMTVVWIGRKKNTQSFEYCDQNYQLCPQNLEKIRLRLIIRNRQQILLQKAHNNPMKNPGALNISIMDITRFTIFPKFEIRLKFLQIVIQVFISVKIIRLLCTKIHVKRLLGFPCFGNHNNGDHFCITALWNIYVLKKNV